MSAWAIPDVVEVIAPPVVVDVNVSITDIPKASCHKYKALYHIINVLG